MIKIAERTAASAYKDIMSDEHSYRLRTDQHAASSLTVPKPVPGTSAASRPPVLVQYLGAAGVIPQLGTLAVLLFGDQEYAFAAMALGYAYAALILSFVGGMWWGLAAQPAATTPRWLWVAGIHPSLIALACVLPWAIGAARPAPGLIALGITLVATLAIDVRVRALGLCPRWWLALRAPLSTGLGIITAAIGFAA